MSNTRAVIDLGRLKANAAAFVAASPEGLDLMAVVKADAYGHGAVVCAQSLAAMGVRAFAVATLEEAEELRAARIADPILVFAPPLRQQLPAFEKLALDLSITNLELLDTVATRHPELLRRGHVKIDTGMGRVGIPLAVFPAAVDKIQTAGVLPKAFWTHLAFSAHQPDAESEKQVAVFRACLADAGLSDSAAHLLNTGGFLHHPDLRGGLPDASFSRIGIGLYGGAHTDASLERDLLPVMQVVSRVLQVKVVAAGAGVSYGHTWHAPTDRWIATVGAGYADGVPRLLSNRGWVGSAGTGARYPIVGNVCMDMFMIDLGPADRGDGGAPIGVGDEVVLFGRDGPDVRTVARWAETISYEVYTGISARVERNYVESEVVY